MATWSLTENLEKKVSRCRSCSDLPPGSVKAFALSSSALAERFSEATICYNASNAQIMLDAVRKPVLEATSDGSGLPAESLLVWIAKMTCMPDKDGAAFQLIMMELASNLYNAKEKWRSAYKSLLVLGHLLVNGSAKMRMVAYWNNQARLSIICQLRSFVLDEDGFKRHLEQQLRMRPKIESQRQKDHEIGTNTDATALLQCPVCLAEDKQVSVLAHQGGRENLGGGGMRTYVLQRMPGVFERSVCRMREEVQEISQVIPLTLPSHGSLRSLSLN
ncbi:hypothetical protein RvY_15039 [Ramazzottius varieornatus]|uniref:ENTH domain-containing protein n=1 Tax=Ramazzottius varieornatus TaxID=947166 RepID=A0A1D1VYB6_RAMVA|nr:hypothetical protein RvY_15039 [Ramazzottius varieornatus]